MQLHKHKESDKKTFYAIYACYITRTAFTPYGK